MPYMTTEQINASRLIMGDTVLVSDAGPEFAKATSVIVKTKYVYVKYEDVDMEARYVVDEKVTVRRKKASRAEIDDATERHAARWARQNIATADDNALKTKQKLIDDLDFVPGYHRSTYVHYVEAQTEATIWRRVAAFAKRDDTSIIDALHAMREELIEQLIDARHSSGSTSDSANLVDSIELDVKSGWLRTLKYKLPNRGSTHWSQ